jgi:hypothetical protein
MRNKQACNILVGKPEEKKPFGKPRLRRKNNIKTNFKEITSEGVNQINLTWDENQWQVLMNTTLNLRIT